MFSSLPDYLLKRLQRVQNTCAEYVLTKFAGIDDLQGLGWLPIKERIHCNIAKLAHKSIYDTECPIKLKQHVVGSYNLRSLSAPKLELGNKHDKGIFQDEEQRYSTIYPPKLGTAETTYNFLAM